VLAGEEGGIEPKGLWRSVDAKVQMKNENLCTYQYVENVNTQSRGLGRGLGLFEPGPRPYPGRDFGPARLGLKVNYCKYTRVLHVTYTSPFD